MSQNHKNEVEILVALSLKEIITNDKFRTWIQTNFCPTYTGRIPTDNTPLYHRFRSSCEADFCKYFNNKILDFKIFSVEQ